MSSPSTQPSQEILRMGCWYDTRLSREGEKYIHYLRELLAQPFQVNLENLNYKRAAGDYAVNEENELDFLLYWEAERSWWRRWFGLTPALNVVRHTSSSVLVVRKPRWPLRRILLILRGDETDEAAIQWLERLARPAQADVFVLPIVPPVPAMYRYGSIYRDVLLQAQMLLAEETYSGAQIRRLGTLFTQWGVQDTLLLHDSAPKQRIVWASLVSDCDLILLRDEPYHWMHRTLLGELVNPLLRWAEKPVLVARDLFRAVE